MKEKILNILKITGITLGCLLGVCILLSGVNLIFPSTHYFGHRFMVKKYDSGQMPVQSIIQYPDYNLNIITDRFNVEIYSSSDSSIDGWASYSYSGVQFGVSEAENLRIIQTEADNTLTLKTLEPLGWVATIDCKLVINLSDSFTYNITVSTKGANTLIKDVEVDNLNLISTSGNLKVQKEHLELTSLNVITKTGNVDFRGCPDVTILDRSFISAQRSDVTFKNLTGGFDIHADTINFNATDIDVSAHGLALTCSGGSFKAATLISGDNDFVVTANSCLVQIHQLTGKSNITTTSGNVTVKNFNSNHSIIRTTSGKVTVEMAADNIFVTTTSGSITVEKFYKIGQFATQSGNITVNSKSPLNADYYTHITTNTGNVTFQNDVNSSVVNITDGGTADIKLWRVAQQLDITHKLSNTNGKTTFSIMAKADDVIRFKLTGNVSGSIRGLELYASTAYIYKGQPFTNQSTVEVIGGKVQFVQLDPAP